MYLSYWYSTHRHILFFSEWQKNVFLLGLDCLLMSLFPFFTVSVCDMIYDLSKLSPNTEPSLNSRAAFVCGMSPIDLSSILSWSIKRPAGEKIVCSRTCSVYMPLYWWLESDYRTLKSFMSRLNRTNIVRSFSIVHWLLPNILKGYLNGIIKGFVCFFCNSNLLLL